LQAKALDFLAWSRWNKCIVAAQPPSPFIISLQPFLVAILGVALENIPWPVS
jgi:hypothetical protein